MMPEPSLNSASRRPQEPSRKEALAPQPCRAIERLCLSLLQQESQKALLQAAVHAMRQSLNLRGVLAWQFDERSSQLHLAASAGVMALPHPMLHPINPEFSPTAAALAVNRRTHLFLPDIQASSLTWAFEGQVFDGDCGGLFASPLLADGAVLGALEFIGRSDDSSFSQHEELMERLTLLTAVGLRRVQQVEEVEKLAALDPLTGLPNRRASLEFLNSRMAECRRSGKPLALLLLDVDHFRQFNEESGHDEGDRVLKLVAEVLKRSIRAYDLAGRFGGEEFLIILPGVDSEAALQSAERIRQRIEGLTRSGESRITASLGAALYPESAEESSSLIKLADRALYKAKRLGRNRVCEASWQDQSDGRYLSDLVISLTQLEFQSKVQASLNSAEGSIEAVKAKMGLRLGHLDLLRAALCLMAVTQMDGGTARLADETESGDLRAVQNLIEQVRLDRLSSRVSVALAEVIKSQNDGRFGPISVGRTSHQAPAA